MLPINSWPDVRDGLVRGTINSVQDLDKALKIVGENLSPTSLFDTLEEIWDKPKSSEIIDHLLGWGTASFRFRVIRQAIMQFVDRRQLLKNEGHENSNPTFGLAPEILTERILQKDPKVLSELDVINNAESKNLFHYAIEYGAENVVYVILKLFKDNKIEFPEKLLVESTRWRESPLMELVTKNESPSLVQTILEALPALPIDKSVLSNAIKLRKNDILLTFTTIRPDCVTIELLNHCISFDQKGILNEVLKTRNDLLQGNGLLHSAVRKGNKAIIETLLKACPDLAIEYDGEISPLYCLQQEDVKVKLDQTSRQDIRSIIVPYIVRRAETQLSPDGTRQISATEQIRRLLADPEGREISLDLGGFRHSSKSIEPFLKMIKNLSCTPNPKATSLLTVEFETTLRYVDIPVPTFPRLDDNSPSIPERLEAKLILDWLRESKNVTGIYELRVRDSLFLPHKEEVIFQSLDGFDIEVLDWMRPDMSARPLVKSCSRLKKLTLYVSTWASLSYWVSGDGYVHLNEFHEVREPYCYHLLRNVEMFILTILGFLDFSTTRNSKDCSTAVEVTQLGPFIEAYTLLQQEFQDPEFRAETRSEPEISPIINVAVIDTGVDPDSIKCFEICGASFVSSESGESPWWFSYHPHGTQMAKVITELNPFCRLLVAKVGDLVMDMTVDRVIQALEWAIKSRADVISISIAFFKHDDRLQLAIQEAYKANIVVIVTTAGEAYRREEAYTATSSQVLSIAATDYWGKETSESVKEHADFMFPGENIMARTSFLGSSNSTDEVSGTSVATAIASGVASLILACHRLSLSKLRSDTQTWERNERLKIPIVRGVFTKMMDNNSAKFVKPWLFFGDSGDQTSWGEARSTLDWLSKKKFRDEK
ncbi:Thermostable alkaline protease [Trichoderma lentiforme]|uniref:Thermostable alkaline protease n=1 Tax=Trichoderma lentiforme TaxID=1567552 RepID=A0A9P4X588_9HYPO|nr:Thermostable alkaline protease [Trichoderma lentiforme]